MTEQLTNEMFQNALFNEDELGSVIRVHLHIEFYVNEIIERLVPFHKDLKPINLNYFGKVNLICALGVKQECKTTLIALGTIRNKFAHNPVYKLTKSEVNNLYKSLSEQDRSLLQASHNKTRKKQATKDSKVKAYRDLLPKDQFIIIAVYIRIMVQQILNEVTTKTV